MTRLIATFRKVKKTVKLGFEVQVFKFPEVCIVGYAFLLNLAWEAIQSPLFFFEQQSSLAALSGCLLFCSGVDALMTLIAFWTLALARKDRYWFLRPEAKDWILFVVVAVSLAVLSEYTAVHYRDLWKYSTLMPVIPGLDIGVIPIIQWLLLPPLALWLTGWTMLSCLLKPWIT